MGGGICGKIGGIFQNVEKNSVVFIDEAEILFPKREELNMDSGSSERASVVTTFLEHIDGIKSLSDVLFVAATNNITMIDEAILRAGRFDMKIYIGTPDEATREKLWKYYLKKSQENINFEIYNSTMNLDYIVQESRHFTGTDIKEIVRRVLWDYANSTLENLGHITITPEKTHRGLEYYIKKYRYQNTVNRGIIPEKEKIFLGEIGGQKELKKELEKIIFQINHREKFSEMWVPMSKWLLLYWPPWTGKTLTAKIIANETNLLFYVLTAKDFLSQNGVEWLKKMFEKIQWPAIVFIDEIDAIWRNRDISNTAQITILNALLQKMDGFQGKDDVFFIGATNSLDRLDEALTRAGRFDTKILIDVSDLEWRKEIFHIHIKKSVDKNGISLYEKNIDYDAIAK